MKTVFCSEYPQNTIGAFSGIPYHMSRAIQAASRSFDYIESPPYDIKKGRKDIMRIGRFVSQSLKGKDFDYVTCQGSSMIPFLETEKPVVLWHDSIWFALMGMEFDEFKARYPALYEWDCMVLEKCDLICFAAEWLKEQTLAHYKTPRENIHVIPFGANVDPGTRNDVEGYISRRHPLPCRLTFLGYNWLRKGLPLAYDVTAKLNARGIRTELNVIGCNLPTVDNVDEVAKIDRKLLEEPESFLSKFHEDSRVRQYGVLQKDNPSELRKLREILQTSHFLLHPAHFECFGIALAEANAFGVPVLATNNHGPKSIVRNGFNGYLFDRNEYVERAVDFIILQMERYATRYRSLALTSYLEYCGRLNWETGAQRIKRLAGGINPLDIS
jgi:glycosyltransferase involved in cell wall biosynthesis